MLVRCLCCYELGKKFLTALPCLMEEFLIEMQFAKSFVNFKVVFCGILRQLKITLKACDFLIKFLDFVSRHKYLNLHEKWILN